MSEALLFETNGAISVIGATRSISKSINKKFLVLCPNVKTSTKKMFLKWDQVNQNESRNNINPEVVINIKIFFINLFILVLFSL